MPALASAHPTARPLRNPFVQTHVVEDETVLSGGAHREIVALNASARAVWEHCDGTATIPEISQKLAHAHSADYAAILGDVRSVVDDLHVRGLLDLPGTASDASHQRPVTFRPAFEHHCIDVYIEPPGIAAAFKRIMGSTFDEDAGLTLGRIEVREHDGGFQVRDNRGNEELFLERRDVLTWIKRRVVTRLVRARPDLLWFHAGAAARDGHVLLCTGKGGSGKSTLTAALYAEGWDYLSDDVIPYDPALGCALAFPLTPVYRQGTDELVPQEALSTLKRSRVTLDPARIATGPIPVRTIVFPTFQPRSKGTIQRRPPGSAVVTLASHCFNLDRYKGNALSALCKLAEQAAAYTVEHNADRPALTQLQSSCLW